MGACNLDHSIEDVRKKLEQQKDCLPTVIYEQCSMQLKDEQHQSLLNALFHLLKKYDLASVAERQKRNEQILQLISS